MYKIIFSTKSLENISFTSGWSYLTDANGMPCLGEINFFENKMICISTEISFALHLLLEIPKFGKVIVNTSVLKANSQQLDLLEQLIIARLDQIEPLLSRKGMGLLSKALKKIINQKNDLKKLSKLMWLGERAIIYDAEKKLSKRIKMNHANNFLFGGQAFGVGRSYKYKKIHEETFNLGVAPFYFFLLKPNSREKTDWELTDRVVNWLSKTNRVIKGHPLVWFHPHALPEWIKQLTFEGLKKFLTEHITLVINRYKDQIRIWDITNEFPCADANGLNLDVKQLIELLKLISNLVKELQPEAERIINISDIFGANSFIHDKPSIPPIHFLKLCVENGIEFESIGLQFYMGMKKEFTCRELLDIGRKIDEYASFRKNIHITELGWPSKHDIDPGSFFSSDHPEAGGWWHKKWNEQLQAEFLGRLITLFASKTQVKSITWWDLTDNGTNRDIGSRFIPFGGLTRKDFSFKPALLKFQEFRSLISQPI